MRVMCIPFLLNATLLATLVHAQPDTTCYPIDDTERGYSFCSVKGWYHLRLPSGAHFLCSEKRGRCVSAVGGTPLRGEAVISVLPANVALSVVPQNLKQFAHLAISKQSTPKYSEIQEVQGTKGATKYIVAKQTLLSGAVNDAPVECETYFVETFIGMFKVMLMFNAGDTKFMVYRQIALQIVRSLGSPQGKPGQK